MLLPFVLGSSLAGGVLVLGMPLAFASLLGLRYPKPSVSAIGHVQRSRTGGAGPHEQRASLTLIPTGNHAARKPPSFSAAGWRQAA